MNWIEMGRIQKQMKKKTNMYQRNDKKKRTNIGKKKQSNAYPSTWQFVLTKTSSF